MQPLVAYLFVRKGATTTTATLIHDTGRIETSQFAGSGSDAFIQVQGVEGSVHIVRGNKHITPSISELPWIVHHFS